MKSLLLTLGVFVIAFQLMSPSVWGEETSQQKRSRLIGKLNNNLLITHNRERQRNGRRPLALDARLTRAAQRHADWMANNNNLKPYGEKWVKPISTSWSWF